jgi:cell division protease FtsH
MLDAFDPKLDAVVALRNMLSYISAWQKDSIGWDEMQHSLLISGPTGTGKTYLARAMANTSGLPLIASSFADWQRCGNLSDTLKAMHATFQEAREKAPVILFLDEIDSVGSRAHRDHNSAYTDQVINAFLIQMDGTMQNQGVLIIAATNHLSAIDPAVLRPGRFDKIVELGLPDLRALQHIVATAASGALIFDDVKKVARAAVGSSAATVDGAVRAAKSVARRTNTDLSANLIIAELSPSAQNAHLERRIALHECGHAALALLYGQKVRHIRIGNDTGEVARKSGAMEQKLEEYEDELAIVLGGRAAEKILTGEISGGAGGPADSDIGRASTLALDIELRFGLGQHGNLWAPMPIEIAMRDPALKQIVAKSIERAYARALTDIARLAPIVRDMAKALIDARELSGSDLDDWILRIAGSQTKEFSVETGNVVAFRRLHG